MTVRYYFPIIRRDFSSFEDDMVFGHDRNMLPRSPCVALNFWLIHQQPA
jgi:hypothetical protein